MQVSLAVAGLVLASVWATAQTDAGNGVARVSLMRGDVTVQRGDSGELTEAAINAPLVTGDRMLTGPGSRAELQFDFAHFLRLSANSEVRMLELRPERYLVAVAEGTVAFSRIDQFESEVEVNTPSVSVRPINRGNFRVTVFPDGSSEISVREGQVEVYTPAGVERLGPGRTMMARGDRDNPEFQYIQQARRDEFDNWNRDRDRLIRRSESYRYVDRSIPGAHELDAYGSWVNVAPYGMVWQPRVAGGWAPYRHGRWSWVDYYGWNWISYDPWGWAPFHYGRWFNSPGFGWCWYPGGFGRQFYSPAVVGFFGFGGVGVGIGFGNVGWVPLAPFEPFYPWWGGRWGGWHGGGWRNNRTFIDNSVTVVNNTNITNVYRNARVGNGYTVVDGQQFARGASVQHNGTGIESLRTASSVRGQLPVPPDRGSLRYSDRAVSREQYASRLDRTEGRQFHTRTQPSRVDRASFDTQRGAMRDYQQQAFSRGESAQGSVSRSATRGDGAGVGGDSGNRGGTRGVATQPAQGMTRGASAEAGSEAGFSRGASTRGASAGDAVADSPSRGDAQGTRGSVQSTRGAGDAAATQ
ncbi:MAG: FecR domain-containing protein, partial [Bryobacterales bacterium]|nr:FecR domain-containing protein [Bryobacterales bacterium]